MGGGWERVPTPCHSQPPRHRGKSQHDSPYPPFHVPAACSSAVSSPCLARFPWRVLRSRALYRHQANLISQSAVPRMITIIQNAAGCTRRASTSVNSRRSRSDVATVVQMADRTHDRITQLDPRDVPPHTASQRSSPWRWRCDRCINTPAFITMTACSTHTVHQ